MRTSIRGRLVFSYVLMTVLSVAVMGGLGLSLVSELGQLREQRQLGLSALAIADQAEPWLDGQAAPVVLGELAQGAAFLLDARVRILGSEATVLADAMAVDQGAQIAWLAAAPADPAADPAADPSEPRPGEAPAEPTFARRLEDVHELIFASGALTQAEQGRPAGGLTFALRRGEPSFGPGGMQLELLTQAAPPGQVVTRGLELARVVHALDADPTEGTPAVIDTTSDGALRVLQIARDTRPYVVALTTDGAVVPTYVAPSTPSTHVVLNPPVGARVRVVGSLAGDTCTFTLTPDAEGFASPPLVFAADGDCAVTEDSDQPPRGTPPPPPPPRGLRSPRGRRPARSCPPAPRGADWCRPARSSARSSPAPSPTARSLPPRAPCRRARGGRGTRRRPTRSNPWRAR